jgi:trk system potassium uptake protein TrkH
MNKQKKFNLSPLQTLAIGFAVIIFMGSLLLWLPISSRGSSLSFLEALFTATSATCVTGLVIFDTYTQFTFFGQLVIIILIQIGGLGFMTVAVMFFMALGKRIGLKERVNLMEAMNSMQIGGIVRLAKRILIATASIELIGAGLLMIRFIPQFGVGQGIWFSFFHAISAFCNAGFDLMGAISPYTSLTPFVGDTFVIIVIILLIVIGGIGFLVWNDIAEHKHHIFHYRLHSKIILMATLSIIILSTALFLVIEWNHAFSHMNFGEKLLAATFTAVTPRTAGFHTIPITALTEAGSGFTIILMIIGAGPGSTAGGIKITTMIVMFFAMIGHVRGDSDINIFGRRIEGDIVRKAYDTALFYLFLAFIGTLIILSVQNFTLHDVLFESFSAIGTVGLSRGITASLSSVSRWVIIVLMYSGRVGSMAVAMAFVERKHHNGHLRNPAEKIIVG